MNASHLRENIEEHASQVRCTDQSKTTPKLFTVSRRATLPSCRLIHQEQSCYAQS